MKPPGFSGGFIIFRSIFCLRSVQATKFPSGLHLLNLLRSIILICGEKPALYAQKNDYMHKKSDLRSKTEQICTIRMIRHISPRHAFQGTPRQATTPHAMPPHAMPPHTMRHHAHPNQHPLQTTLLPPTPKNPP
ncbi:hypothetical protein JOC95_000519 [Bacillus tianshenii]|uniref:Uncharacterized protein n=1 Tax=Sutcliffiella tianshenii TaxID=1463404 RepID=A0ABS2NW18_9BACI|nr:hypothetical protein [Bacillus tianshenii]